MRESGFLIQSCDARYTLEPLRTLGPDALDPKGIQGISKITLCEIEVAWDNAQCRTTTWRAGDLFASAATDTPQGTPIPQTGSLTRACFRIRFADSPAPRMVVLCPPHIIRLTNPSDAEPVGQWLCHHGFRLKTSDEAQLTVTVNPVNAPPTISHQPTASPWRALESIPGQAAAPAVWRRSLGAHYPAFSAAFLERSDESAWRVPCPRECGCSHEVVRHGPDRIVGECRCDPSSCSDLMLSREETEVWKLSWPKLGRLLCGALGLRARPASLGLYNTQQIGAWSIGAVPVILTIQHDRYDFQHVVTALAAGTRQPFILLAPTSENWDVISQKNLPENAGFFDLDSNVILSANGTLQPKTPPGELFAKFIPQPKETLHEDAARRAFALVQQLDSDGPARPPSVLTVFRLYCIDELSADQIAKKCLCSKLTVLRRLKLIRAKTGADPKNFRGISPHLEKMERDISDDRAIRIRRKGLIGADDEG